MIGRNSSRADGDELTREAAREFITGGLLQVDRVLDPLDEDDLDAEEQRLLALSRGQLHQAVEEFLSGCPSLFEELINLLNRHPAHPLTEKIILNHYARRMVRQRQEARRRGK